MDNWVKNKEYSKFKIMIFITPFTGKHIRCAFPCNVTY